MRMYTILKNQFLVKQLQSWLMALQQMLLCNIFLAITSVLISIFVEFFLLWIYNFWMYSFWNLWKIFLNCQCDLSPFKRISNSNSKENTIRKNGRKYSIAQAFK